MFLSEFKMIRSHSNTVERHHFKFQQTICTPGQSCTFTFSFLFLLIQYNKMKILFVLSSFKNWLFIDHKYINNQFFLIEGGKIGNGMTSR